MAAESGRRRRSGQKTGNRRRSIVSGGEKAEKPKNLYREEMKWQKRKLKAEKSAEEKCGEMKKSMAMAGERNWS